jgi:TetR/AcrR family transcriptional regulator, regulator of cefoperazone and chloramphenicol sensitivity
MANIKNNSSSKQTQRRLLEAAGEVFAEYGFHSATTKEITDRAGASLASINYHFGDKAELYAAVIRGIESEISDLNSISISLTGTPSDRLHQFVTHLVERILSHKPTDWERVLFAREWAQPSPAMSGLIERVILPVNVQLSSLIATVIGRDQSSQSVGLLTASIIGQIVYHMTHPVQLLHPQVSASLAPQDIAKHIAHFSLAAIESLRLSEQPGDNG